MKLSRATRAPRFRRGFLVVAVAAALGLSACASPAVSAPTASAPTRAKASQPVAVFIGDSYTSGYGASAPTLAWPSLVAAGEGWKAVNLGRGGTGYLATSGPNGCGKEYCPNYQEMVAEAVTNGPDVVVVAGGQNDFTAFTENPDAVGAAIEATYESLRDALPDTRIIAVGPSIAAAKAAGQTTTAIDALVQEAAESVGGSYISLIEPPVFTAEMILPDAAHVNDAGHAAIAARIREALAG